ncbi:SMI1/KNR4 family protein [Dactylosporangium sp. NPDC051541]|uniref:SMI1/KNR4 family protein n=1 Tax=Dactylosporangium sp. NPDC051541 TaxID=3363977 RepID=UPI0037B3A843
MDEIESVMHQVGAAFAAGLTQPGSMEVSLIAHGHQSRTYDTAGDAARIGRWGAPGGPDLDGGLERLRVLAGAGGRLAVELTGSPGGDYAVSCFAGGDGGGQFGLESVVVLDEDYRFPGHPRPGMPRPAGAALDDRPTDAAVLADLRDLVAEFAAEHTRRRGVPPRFAPGRSEGEIRAAEERLGFRLPEDVRALYRTIGDDDAEHGLLGCWHPAPLEQVVAWYHQQSPGSYGWDDGLFTDTPVVYETDPAGHVRRVSRSDWWVTFAPDHGLNYAALDLDPGPAGAAGQVIAYGRDVYGPVVYVAASVRQLIRDNLASMRAAAGDWTPEWPSAPEHRWYADLGDADPAALVAAMTDPGAVQFAHLRRVDRVRLADLAGLPRLRTIKVLDVRSPAAYVDLRLAPGLPVEQVDVTAGHFEPERLADAATLRYVRLAGNREPVRVAALAGRPDLVALDLADAVVGDVAAVAAFPALRVLTLNAGQWRELFASGWEPARLAGARMGGRGGVAALGDWQRGLRPGGVRDTYRTVRRGRP